MTGKIPPWLRGTTFGSHGDIYMIDNNNSCLERHVCWEDGISYNRPLKVQLTAGQPGAPRPRAVAYLASDDDQKNRILITLDNKTLLFASADLTIQDKVKLKGVCTGIAVAKLRKNIHPHPFSDPVILLLNATDNTLDLLTPSGEMIQSIPLPNRLGLQETHGYLTWCHLEGRDVLVMSSTRGAFTATLQWTRDEGWAITLRDELLANEQFSPQGVCLVDSFLYVVNSRKDRVIKMNLVCGESEEVTMEYLSYMSVNGPCAVHGRKVGHTVLLCVTTLTGRYELLDF